MDLYANRQISLIFVGRLLEFFWTETLVAGLSNKIK